MSGEACPMPSYGRDVFEFRAPLVIRASAISSTASIRSARPIARSASSTALSSSSPNQ